MNVKPGDDAKVGILTKGHMSLSVTTMFHQLLKLFHSVMEPIPKITLSFLSVFPPGTQLWIMGP